MRAKRILKWIVAAVVGLAILVVGGTWLYINVNIEVNGSIPVTFADFGIRDPSSGPATTEDKGLVEFLLVFSK